MSPTPSPSTVPTDTATPSMSPTASPTASPSPTPVVVLGGYLSGNISLAGVTDPLANSATWYWGYTYTVDWNVDPSVNNIAIKFFPNTTFYDFGVSLVANQIAYVTSTPVASCGLSSVPAQGLDSATLSIRSGACAPSRGVYTIVVYNLDAPGAGVAMQTVTIMPFPPAVAEGYQRLAYPAPQDGYPGTLTFTSPTTPDITNVGTVPTYTFGSTVLLRWTATLTSTTGNMNTVLLQLFHYNYSSYLTSPDVMPTPTPLYNISVSVSNVIGSNSFNWTIPSTLAPGPYALAVRASVNTTVNSKVVPRGLEDVAYIQVVAPSRVVNLMGPSTSAIGVLSTGSVISPLFFFGGLTYNVNVSVNATKTAPSSSLWIQLFPRSFDTAYQQSLASPLTVGYFQPTPVLNVVSSFFLTGNPGTVQQLQWIVPTTLDSADYVLALTNGNGAVYDYIIIDVDQPVACTGYCSGNLISRFKGSLRTYVNISSMTSSSWTCMTKADNLDVIVDFNATTSSAVFFNLMATKSGITYDLSHFFVTQYNNVTKALTGQAHANESLPCFTTLFVDKYNIEMLFRLGSDLSCPSSTATAYCDTGMAVLTLAAKSVNAKSVWTTSSGGLSGAAVAAIVISVLIVVGFSALMGWCVYKKSSGPSYSNINESNLRPAGARSSDRPADDSEI